MERADHLVAFLLFIVAVVYPLVDTKRFQRKLALLGSGTYSRVRLYWELIAWLWSISAIVFALWLHKGRSFAVLGFRFESSGRFWLVSALVVAVTIFYVGYLVSLKKSTELREKTRLSWEETSLASMMPRTPQELRYWILCSISASSEEVVYRGFLLWYVGLATNSVVAWVVSVVLFALGHSYQGVTGMVRTGIVGIIFLAIYCFSGSLWPAIVFHVVQDIFGGITGYLSLKTSEDRSLNVGFSDKH